MSNPTVNVVTALAEFVTVPAPVKEPIVVAWLFTSTTLLAATLRVVRNGRALTTFNFSVLPLVPLMKVSPV